MADVEESSISEAPSVHEMRASEAPDAGSSQRPGGITRHSRSQSPDKRLQGPRGSTSPSPSRKTEWKTFNKEYPQKRADVHISDYSKDETAKRKKWEKEKRALRERQARILQERAEADAAKQRELQEKQAMEHKARVQERLKKQEAKIRRAAEERMRREQAYQDLLSKTREKGLLFERLQEAGESKVNAIHQEKQSDYVNTLGRMRKLGAQEISRRPDLHPSLRVVQRRQQEETLKREAEKEPTAFTPKAAGSPVAGSPVSSFMTTRRMPGASLSGGFATGAAASGGHGPPKQTRKRRPARKPAPPRRDVVERASSPLTPPGVEIHVDGVLYQVPQQQLERQASGVPVRRSTSSVNSTARRASGTKPAAVLAPSPSASGSFSRQSATSPAAEAPAPVAAVSAAEESAASIAERAASGAELASAAGSDTAAEAAAAASEQGNEGVEAAEEAGEQAGADAAADSGSAGGGADGGGEDVSATGDAAADAEEEAGEDYSSADDNGDEDDEAGAADEAEQDGAAKSDE